ncbi:hypothetical protein RBE51_13395 [Pseudomonas taiwanensis]|uniref:hypothetical protein n=1 Tax=Pseudomonas taiwanensis TaxID=470150 RepID=UPI0028E0737E|nr:hypothetical protein [Pseudomonas taiwanensis]MDT8923809.1 hypothetical protein [Pseudomonas taiwanensis]
MSKENSYAGLSFSTCIAGALGSVLTFLVGEYPDDRFWRGFMYAIPPITLIVYTVIEFVETRIREWWANRSEKADVDLVVKESESILKDDSVGDAHKAEALETRNNAKMSSLKNKARRLKKHELVESEVRSATSKRNRSTASKLEKAG